MLCPVYALRTPLNTLIHLSGHNQTLGTRCKGSLDSWNCNFCTKSKILRDWRFYCCTKKEASFSYHWRMTCSHTAFLNSKQSLLPMSLLQTSSSCLRAHFHPRSFAVVCFCFGIVPLLNGELWLVDYCNPVTRSFPNMILVHKVRGIHCEQVRSFFFQ